MKRHDWQYKHVPEKDYGVKFGRGSYYVLCAECGLANMVFETEEQAQAQIRRLNAYQNSNYGFNRRSRVAKAMSKGKGRPTPPPLRRPVTLATDMFNSNSNHD